MEIIKRTFEAKNFPKDSAERKKLNEKSETSEYMTSYKYVVLFDDGFRRTFVSKQQAEEYVQSKMKEEAQ